MSSPAALTPFFVGGGYNYQISRSVRLRSSASAYLNRIFATGSGETTGTFSVWFKRGKLGSSQNIFLVGNSATTYAGLYFDAGDTLSFARFNTTAQAQLTTTQVFRDPSAWYHVIVAWDSTQATASNRIKMYVNGVQITSFTTATYPTQNLDMYLLNGDGTTPHEIGYYPTSGNYFDGYLAEIYAVKGQALTASSFGTTDSNGIWQPKAYTGTYGTNGFYLKFTDNSAATAAAIGKDYSGNGNNWTPNNISVTAGVTYDSMVDSPTVGYGASNYCVLNPLNSYIQATLADANLSYSNGTVSWKQSFSTFQLPTSGKWYCEFTTGPSGTGGGVDIGISDYLNATYRLYRSGGNKASNNGGVVAYGSAFSSAGTVVGIAVDTTNGTITFYNNNVSQGVAFTDVNSAAPATGWYLTFQANNASTQYVNFGQRPFTYTPPSGFAALNTYNLPAATINNGATVMAASTYTGTGVARSISNGGNNTSGVTFKPDLVWMKQRSSIQSNVLQDSVRGATKYLVSDSTGAEVTDVQTLTSFNTDGFSLGTSTGINGNTSTYIGWQWQAGQGTTSTNTDGSITSTVSVNKSAGFSIVTYTGTGSAATVGHGLGVAPKMIVYKDRAAVANWVVMHTSLANMTAQYLQLNTTAAAANLASTVSAPTSTTFGSSTSITSNGDATLAYCWSEVAGYSKFGSYTGNGSTDGPFVYCGFRPRWVLIKRTDNLGDWWLHDTSRDTYNVAGQSLYANSSAAEFTQANLDFLSNGFKLRQTAQPNTSGATFMFAAFAENPFNISRAR